ncbi:MAG: TatD family hydrolase [Chloroflexia bacterium]
MRRGNPTASPPHLQVNIMMHEPVTTSATLVDTHAHLDFEDYDNDRQQVVDRARQAGVSSIITLGIEPPDWQRNIEIADQFDGMYVALGVHPNSADQATNQALSELERLCRSHGGRKVVALGETGLDYYRHYVSHDEQKRSFRAHLDLARQLDLPVIVHNRDAHEDVLEILRRDGKGTRGVMHSFSGDEEYAVECIRLGYMISLAGPVTFKKAVDKHSIAASVPLDMLLVETDCPFLTPEPFRGRRNEPAYVAYTARAIANIRGITFEEFAAQTTSNAVEMFSLDKLDAGAKPEVAVNEL